MMGSATTCQKLSGTVQRNGIGCWGVKSQAIVQVVDVPLLIPPKKAEAMEICPACGGPAEVDLFWSSSPETPRLKVLKKQICFGGRPGRSTRFRTTPVARCPVQVVIVETASESEVVAEIAQPQPEPTEPMGQKLDAAVELLSRLDESGCQQLLEAARLTHQFRQRKAALQAKLKASL